MIPMSQTRSRAALTPRLAVLLRTVAGVAGGYVVSALAAAVLAVWLPTARAEAVMAGTLVALAVFPCAVMWCFAARNAARAWVGLLVPIAALAALYALHGVGA